MITAYINILGNLLRPNKINHQCGVGLQHSSLSFIWGVPRTTFHLLWHSKGLEEGRKQYFQFCCLLVYWQRKELDDGLNFILDYLRVWNMLFMAQIPSQECLVTVVYYFLPHKQSSFSLHNELLWVTSAFFKLTVSALLNLQKNPQPDAGFPYTACASEVSKSPSSNKYCLHPVRCVNLI